MLMLGIDVITLDVGADAGVGVGALGVTHGGIIIVIDCMYWICRI